MNNQNVVYTCITDNYDKITLEKPDGNYDFVCFFDQVTFDSNRDLIETRSDIKFELVNQHKNGIDANRYFKINPHLVLPHYEKSVYIDGNIVLKKNPFELETNLEEYCIQLYEQPDRDCAYEEIDELVRVGLVYGKDAHLLKRSLRNLGLPDNNGLFEANIIYRSHNKEACKTLMTIWWCLWCNVAVKRDQPLLALLNFLSDGNYIGSIGNSNLRSNLNAYFEYGTRIHKKRRVPRLFRRLWSELMLYRRG